MEEANKKKHPILIGLIVVFVGLLLIGILRNPSIKEPVTISGTVDFNGIIPPENSDQVAELKLYQKVKGASDFTYVNTTIPVMDNAPWAFTSAVSGETYDLKLDLFVKGTDIKTSMITNITAPASGVVIPMNVSLKDIPEETLKVIQEQIGTKPVTVSGNVYISGHIPSGSTVSILAREIDLPNYVIVSANIPAIDGTKWAWNDAKQGVNYSFKGVLVSNKTFIGESAPIEVVAPASDEVLKISSNAIAPQTSATISGIFQLQGPVKQNMTVLVLQRKSGETTYNEIGRYPAINNTPWSWTKAVSGTSYDIQAALQENLSNISTSNTATTKAPASEVILTLNTQQSLNAPAEAPRISCGSPDSVGGYNAKITYPHITGAKGYYYEVGTQPGYTDIKKEGVPGGDSDVEITVYQQNSQSFYTRYAYITCTDCDVNSSSNWSPFSQTVGFQCSLPQPMLY
jgi:hypothetical protein